MEQVNRQNLDDLIASIGVLLLIFAIQATAILAIDLASGGCIQAGFGHSKIAVVTRQRSSDKWTPVSNSLTKEASQIITKVLRNFAVG